MADRARALREFASRHWPGAAAFFARAEADLVEPEGLGFRAVYASVPRRLGALASSAMATPVELRQARPHWTHADYVRAALVGSALESLPWERRPPWHLQLFEAGEMGEQVSLLRTLSLMEEPARFLETAVQACRTNARSVFEAIVCENPFVSEHFPALNFNQAVLKAIFMEVSARRIEGLEARITPELQRMAAGYESERLAAGRSVPVDIDYLIHYGA